MRIISKLLPASKLKLVISSIGVLGLIALTSFIVFDATKAEVVVNANGEKQSVATHANTVDELLLEVGITVGEHDALSPNKNTKIENGLEINYKKAKQIIVTIDGKEETFYTTFDTMKEFMAYNNLSFTEHDDISHNGGVRLKDGLHLQVTKAFQVTVNNGGQEAKYWTTGGSVQQLLEQNDITYSTDSHDKIKPAVGKKVTEDTVITIVRVNKDIEEIEEKVAFETEKREDSSLEKGKKKVLSEGQEGKRLKKYEVTLENGKEVDRKLIDETVEKESEKRVVAFGTKEPKQNLTTLSSGSKPKSSGKEFRVTASAFTASCSGCSGVTTTGINLNANPNAKVIAVDPSIIPLGTKVWVEGYGEAIAGDTGGNIVGNRIDVHVPTKADAYRWGVRRVKIKILN